MAHENGDKQRPTKGRHVQGMLDETEPLMSRYKGSYLKGTSSSPLESLTKMFSPIICFRSVLMDMISNWGE